ncbi:hypothetical protein HYDPIDRAFT_84550 [Hydnomerulius pinastri MD-312]|nr:hypothetical protein HYDPIDRAFT_84550 [Hydnomerulius pinastri MD-312]
MWVSVRSAVSLVPLLAIFWGLWRRRARVLSVSSTKLPLPPGPPLLFMLRRISGATLDAPWLTCIEWAQVYGDLIHIRIFGQHLIILNSPKVARDLLEGRSANYSDRPTLKANEIFGLDFNSGMLRYGDQWRMHRKLFHQAFRTETATRYHTMQQRKALQLVLNVLHTPDEHLEHLYTYTAAIIMSAVYDYDVAPKNDELVRVIQKATEFGNIALDFKVAVALNAFSFILRLPDWFPGTGLKRTIALSRQYAKDWVELPFRHASKVMESGKWEPSMVSDAMKQGNGTSHTTTYVQDVKAAAATAFGAALQTTSVLHIFLLAMILYPRVQDKAYALIQSVIGTARLPAFADRESLPYIDAILRETLRWNPTTPLSVPHSTTNDDVYAGYFIPKGPFHLIFPTDHFHRAITHNEEKYENPLEFVPERFIGESGELNDDTTAGIAFGFGRRICPGRHLADATLWIAMATLLTVFKFSKLMDEHGKEVDFEPQWISGLTTRPLPFPCAITPRKEGLDAAELTRMASNGTEDEIAA